jgi:hypothetical protein
MVNCQESFFGFDIYDLKFEIAFAPNLGFIDFGIYPPRRTGFDACHLVLGVLSIVSRSVRHGAAAQRRVTYPCCLAFFSDLFDSCYLSFGASFSDCFRQRA